MERNKQIFNLVPLVGRLLSEKAAGETAGGELQAMEQTFITEI